MRINTIHFLILIMMSIITGMELSLLLVLMFPEQINSIEIRFFQETPMEGLPDFTYDCKNMPLYSTSKCLNNNFKQIWFYNSSQTGKTLSYDDIKESGGVCSHSSQIYLKSARYLGFYTEEIVFMTRPDVAHSIALISDYTGYCILDQNFIIGCGRFNY